MGELIIVSEAQFFYSSKEVGQQYVPVVDPNNTVSAPPVYYGTTSSTSGFYPASQPRQPMMVPIQRFETQPVTFDPLVDHLRWAMPFGSTREDLHKRLSGCLHLHEQEMERHFWDKQEINTWFRDEAQGIILMQGFGERQYRIVFLNDNDIQKFKDKLGKPKPHPVHIRFGTHADCDLVLEWVKANVAGPWEVRGKNSGGNPPSISLAIRNLAEAVHTRLRFSEHVIEASEPEEQAA